MKQRRANQSLVKQAEEKEKDKKRKGNDKTRQNNKGGMQRKREAHSKEDLSNEREREKIRKTSWG